MSAYVVIKCDNCDKGHSAPQAGRQLEATPLRNRLKAAGWKSVMFYYRGIVKYDFGERITKFSERKDYCPSCTVPPPAKRNIELETLDYRSGQLEEGPKTDD
jgi:hypothetical protein